VGSAREPIGNTGDDWAEFALVVNNKKGTVPAAPHPPHSQTGGEKMTWALFVAGAVLSWGLYGVSLHRGQLAIGSPMKSLLCVGVAYVLIAVLIPVATLSSEGNLKNFDSTGTIVSTLAGVLGALGAVCILFSFRAGASPLYVMPLVFGGAPLVNVIATAIIHPPKTAPSPMLYVGFLLAAVGAGLVLYYRPAS
jgi:hypothetical protein